MAIEGQAVHFAVSMRGMEESPSEPQSIVLFNAHIAEPLLTHTVSDRTPVLSMAMTDGPSACVCYLTRNGVVRLGPKSKPHRVQSRKRTADGMVASGSGALKRPKLTAVKPAPRPAATVAELLDAPTRHLPPPSSLFDSFLAGLLPDVRPQAEEEEGESSASVSFVIDREPVSVVERSG